MKFNKSFYRPIMFIAATAILFVACTGKVKKSSTFELNGDLAQAGEGIKVYLDLHLPPGDSIVHMDSTAIDKEGKFSFHTAGIYKGFYTVRITKGDYAALILDSNEKVQFTGNAQNLGYTYNVSGSPDSKLFWQYNIMSKTHMMQMDSLQKRFDAIVNTLGGKKERVDSLSDVFQKTFDAITQSYFSNLRAFVKSNASSFACIPAMQELTADDDKDCFYALDSGLTKVYPSSVYVKLFHNQVTAMRRVDIGAMAPDISLPDTTGKVVSLSSLHGKYVLIDFWASWCEPCKESLPGLVKIYDKYKDKNFAIFGVSLDSQHQPWVAAIKSFNMSWTQVSELKKWKSKVVGLYNFDGIPFTVLISPEGKIIDKKLTDSKLEERLQELLK